MDHHIFWRRIHHQANKMSHPLIKRTMNLQTHAIHHDLMASFPWQMVPCMLIQWNHDTFEILRLDDYDNAFSLWATATSMTMWWDVLTLKLWMDQQCPLHLTMMSTSKECSVCSTSKAPTFDPCHTQHCVQSQNNGTVGASSGDSVLFFLFWIVCCVVFFFFFMCKEWGWEGQLVLVIVFIVVVVVFVVNHHHCCSQLHCCCQMMILVVQQKQWQQPRMTNMTWAHCHCHSHSCHCLEILHASNLSMEHTVEEGALLVRGHGSVLSSRNNHTSSLVGIAVEEDLFHTKQVWWVVTKNGWNDRECNSPLHWKDAINCTEKAHQ